MLTHLINLYRLMFHRDYIGKHHLKLSVENLKISLEWDNHQEYLQKKELELRRLRKTCSREEFILQGLKATKECNFIVFSCGDTERYVQFWRGDGQLQGSWPIIKAGNKMARAVYPMLGVLNELDITQKLKKVGEFPSFDYQYYDTKQEENFLDYRIHFANDYEAAQAFTIKVFTDVFEQDLKKLKCRIG